MNYNIIAILFIIIVLLTFIYFTYFINKKKVVSNKPKNTFQKIETDINSYNINNNPCSYCYLPEYLWNKDRKV